MKHLITVLTALGLVTSAFAVDKAELNYKVRLLTAKFEAMQAKPDKCVPAEMLNKAKGIVLLDRTKVGVGLGYQGGSGVALARAGKSDKWSPAAFVRANEGSIGFQLGGEQSFVVILVMNADALRLLTEPNFEFGSEARGTAGNASGGAESTISSAEKPILVYDDRKGLFGGASLKTDVLSPDEKANREYYGDFLTMKDILIERKVEPTDAVEKLTATLSESAKVASK